MGNKITEASAPPAIAASLTKHELVAASLTDDIRSGRLRIGEQLPSEPELSLRFGVSRQTVRASLRTLREQGLVSSQQGVGTRVKAALNEARYSHTFNAPEDVLQYFSSTRQRIIDRTEIKVDASLAEQLGCKPGERWWRLRRVRADIASRAIIAFAEIHIPQAFGAVLDDKAILSEPLFAVIERHFGERVDEIQQAIACVGRMSAEECAFLKLPPDSPGMEITRRYYNRKGRLLETARTLHPCDTYTYSMRVRLPSA